jgi:2-polyprenyl-3-methyl-5-hydroxy-6-metoxy-1,4-benzoquinol methylase
MCGLCLVNPLGDFRGEHETQEYFINDYLPLHLANQEASLAERRSHIGTLNRYFRLPRHARLLDIGCALGFMLQEAKAAGWDAVGVETSDFAARYAEQHTNCPVHSCTLQQASFPCQAFDVVTLMDVIEHVPHPLDLMTEVYRVLRPRGVVFIVTPNFSSVFVRMYGLKAYGVWPEQHVVYFQPATVRRLLRKVGFGRIITGSKDFYPDNLKRVLGLNGKQGQEIKTAFDRRGPLRRLRGSLNSVLMHVPVGDKLVALAQK